MDSNIVKFPYRASRRVYSKMPRRSKNGTPGARAAKAAALQSPPADIVHLPLRAPDRRKLRESPLRDHIAIVSFGATVVGKMRNAELKGESLAAIQPEVRDEWLETLDRAIEAVETVGAGFVLAMKTLKALQSETSDFPLNLPDRDSLS
ncbi:hypothetical protein [Bradyrhizobium sp. Ash2021]|uniref:hypothetical protein n=1 Tax=Bradyrhizobium sp. Ash2021 TaxID=2954771 RepID=UPI002814E64C|nr:hypothetical protein [Bradyrhizobium sp. Ash2021]WMT78759.1 hypothetical protein NL528_21515 [Bradyrhizobium sp. Ash2021]